MTKMVIKRTGVVEKYFSAFTFFSNDFHLQPDKVYINKRLNEVRIKGGSVKLRNMKVLSCEN